MKYRYYNDQQVKLEVHITEKTLSPIDNITEITSKILNAGIIIFLFTTYDNELGKNLAKHEFGHMLGLGDMYADPENPAYLLRTQGVPKDTYKELEDVYTGLNQAKFPEYHAVMDNNTTILNNDVEMVIEAFRTGARQNYQVQKLFGEDNISPVLGKGN